MKKLLRLQLRHYRSAEAQVMLGLLVIMTFVCWISQALFNAPADLVLIIFQIGLWIFIGATTILHYLPYIQIGPGDDYTLPLHIPLPQLWSLAVKLITSLPIVAVAATAHLALAYAFRYEPDVYLPTSRQWLLHASYYTLGVSIIINALAIRKLLKEKMSLPHPLWGFRITSIWRKVHKSIDIMAGILLFAFYFISTRVVATILRDDWAISLPLMVLIICVCSAVITYVNAYLLEKYVDSI